MTLDQLEELDDEPYCARCDNNGIIIVCVDDMCRGCFDGCGAPCGRNDDPTCIRTCPDCKGEFVF